jgi:hypothetical protein
MVAMWCLSTDMSLTGWQENKQIEAANQRIYEGILSVAGIK